MPFSIIHDLPTDIWLCISQFIIHQDLCNLYSVNRAFLQLALNEHYRDVDFLQVNPKTLRFLEHVQYIQCYYPSAGLLQHRSDPNITTRVRRLCVNPVWFNLHPSSVKPSLPNNSSILRRLKSQLSRRLHLDFSHRTSATTDAKQQAEREAIDTLMTSIITLFPNVTSFVIVTQYSPHPHWLPLFLSNTYATFGSTLTRLTINAPLGGFAPLLPSPSVLPSLAELALCFTTDLVHAAPLTDTIAPFLLALTPQLTQLTLMSITSRDHAPLFSALALGSFKRLHTLSLTLVFYSPFLCVPEALTAFLHTTAPTLRHVRLQPYEPTHIYSSQLTAMCAEADRGLVLSRLQTLVITPTTDLPPPDLATTYIARSANTLTSLALWDVCLAFPDLQALVGMFVQRPRESGLKRLYVMVCALSPRVFDLLAEGLPRLEDLDVQFDVVLVDREGKGEETEEGEGREGDRVPEDKVRCSRPSSLLTD